ncbi:MAG: hypothetical protein IPH77_10055 [Ignavibacteria bacterium]|nr:hypothetical protein [Ignavibacteria bacterium]
MKSNSAKFKNKYRIPSARLQSWDYGKNGSYFITICTKNREHFFGEIFNEKMHFNEIGKIADKYWKEIPIHFPFIELGYVYAHQNLIDKNMSADAQVMVQGMR